MYVYAISQNQLRVSYLQFIGSNCEFTHTVCYKLGQTESSHMYFISSPLTLTIWFFIFLEYCVSRSFLFCWNNFIRQRGEELVGFVVIPVYNIVKIIVFPQSMVWCQMEQPRYQEYFTMLKLLFMNL